MACPILWSAFAIINLVGFLTVRHDKRIAQARSKHGRQQRTPERMFWLLCALGGGLAVFAGYQVFRHKTRKPWFLFVSFLGTVVGLAAWYGWFVLLGCLAFVSL